MQKAEPRTIVIVTHDLNEAIKMADNIMILENGLIKQYASKSEVLNDPSSGFVKEYMWSQK
jgi:ABC-type proline/glycine betaine transport system ATPase subunit